MFSTLEPKNRRFAASAQAILPAIKEKRVRAPKYRFTKPNPDNESLVRHSTEVPTIAAVNMHAGDIIPFHAHQHRDKTYTFTGTGSFEVLRYRPGTNHRGKKQILCIRDRTVFVPEDELGTLHIPRGTFHAVICHSVSEGYSRFLGLGNRAQFVVVANGNDPTDIMWEPDTEQLLSLREFDPQFVTVIR